MSLDTSKQALPRVSIIVPAYNCERYIEEALDSVFAQDYPNKEVIVVNDGSSDATLSILQAYDKPIVIVDQANAGAAAARNTGMEKATGQYLAFLDADDIWLVGKLTRQVRFLEEHADYGLVYSNWVCWTPDEHGRFIRQDFANQRNGILVKQAVSGWVYSDLVTDPVLWTSCILIRRSIYQKVGKFDVTLKLGEDYDYWLRISRETKIHKLDDIHAVYRHHDDSITHRPNYTNFEYLVLKRALDKWGYDCPDGKMLDRRFVKQRLANMSFGFAYGNYHYGDPAIAIRSLLSSLRYRPFHAKSWLYILLAVLRLGRNYIANGLKKQ